MNVQHKFRREEIGVYLQALSAAITRETQAPSRIQIADPAEASFNPPPAKAPWRPFQVGGAWGRKNGWAYFRGRFTVPAHWKPGEIRFHLKHRVQYLEHPQNDAYPAGPEGQVFINGKRAGAIDQEHHDIRWDFRPGARVEVSAVFFAGRAQCRHALESLSLVSFDSALEKFYHDARVLLDITAELPETSPAREPLFRVLEAALKPLDRRDLPAYSGFSKKFLRDPGHTLLRVSLPKAQRALDRGLRTLPVVSETPRMAALGHAHIDLAWLWPVSQSKHKCVRTFATQARFLKQYPDWKFNQSSPQAYAWVEKEAPDLFAKIKALIAAGRWDAEGAMWVEPDTNLPSGESLVRQLLYGKKYFKEKLGVDSKVLWLPDVFGYSAALPQLLKLAGVEGFITSKISWSQFNRFPFDTFRWRGLDGTELPVHFISTPNFKGHTATYNAKMTVKETAGLWKEYREKRTGLAPLMTFGFGDGGGGPTAEMIETALRLSKLRLGDFPQATFKGAAEIMREVSAKASTLPAWDGELYLEYHRGTYTTQGWLKRYHRKNEILLHQLEWISSLAKLQGFRWDKPRIDELWKEFLLMQFHDILPGSSVGEVYDDARVSHQRIESEAREMLSSATDFLSRKIDTKNFKAPLLVFNPLSWERSDPFRAPNGAWRDGHRIPAGGWAVVEGAASSARSAGPLSVEPDGRSLSNQFWRLKIDKQGRISSLWDVQNRREVLAPGQPGNVWQLFEDRPMYWDAWDIDLYYKDHPLSPPICRSIRVIERGPVRANVEIRWQLRPVGKGRITTIVQRIALYRDYPRIDFETTVDWHEHHTLLKVAFPIGVRATEASYQIQFGHLKRPTHFNTSWDLARFEVCGHQFADLSEHGYGVSLLNDCKYGHDIHEGVLRLTCIKSPQGPHARADQGEHRFTYSLLPHAGSFQSAEVIRRASELNAPLVAIPLKPARGKLPARFTFGEIDNPAIVLDTVKPAEDGRGLVLRLYESHGSHARGTLTLPAGFKKAVALDLLENPRKDNAVGGVRNGRAELKLTPFQIVTVRLI